MSQGAIFKLVLRDERFDAWFTASDQLRQRLAAIRAKRQAAGRENTQPTFTDVAQTHTLYMHAQYRPYVATASEYAHVKASGDSAGQLGPSGTTLDFTPPTYGHFTSDIALHIRFRAVGSATAAATLSTSKAVSTQPLYRYCAYPGVRLLQCVKLYSDSMLVDEYTVDEATEYGKHFVGADQRAGWDRCHGQQEVRQATFPANGYTGILTYSDGPQTPKFFQEALDLFIPLQFWNCRAVENALMVDSVANTQRRVTCDLAPLGQILRAYIPDPDTINRPGEFIEVPLPFSQLAMEANLYVNSLYVNPEIHDIFASRTGFSLIRVHRRDVKQLQAPEDKILLDQLKFPAETLLVGVRDRRLAADFDRWWLNGTLTVRTNIDALLVPAMIWNPTLGIVQLVARYAREASSLSSPVDALGVIAHGTEIFTMTAAPFYNAYLPIRFTACAAASSCTVSPHDAASFLIPFGLFPGRSDISGYYNLSAGREMYLQYRLKPADFESGRYEITLNLVALNFLVRRGDHVSTKFSL